MASVVAAQRSGASSTGHARSLKRNTSRLFMKPEWKEFLIQNGAEFHPERDYEIESYGNPERENRVTVSGNIICDLSHRGLIQAYGDDARSFLNGQTTSNVNEVSEKHSQLSAYCTAKGRVVATFRLFQRDDAFFLSLPRNILEPTLDRLRMFVLMSKVTLEDGNDALVRLGVSGPEIESELEKALGGYPQTIDEVLTLKNVAIIRIPGTLPRFELYGALSDMQALWTTLNVRCAPVGASNWRLLDILAGLPNVYAGNEEAFTPQMLNLDALNGISFKKGCYPGQEVVARVHYLGKVKRRMYLLTFSARPPIEAGAKLFAEDNDSGQSIGTIVSAARHPDGGTSALGVLLSDYAASGNPVHLDEPSGPAATVSMPPYPFPPDKSQ